MPWLQALAIAQQICQGLLAANEFGIIHRDIKPENILVVHDTDPPLAKIVDFGLCRFDTKEIESLTQSGFLLGTVHYMAPEISQGKNITNAVDVYSLSCLLFELLTAEPPFQADTPIGVVSKHCHETAPTMKSKFPSYSWRYTSVFRDDPAVPRGLAECTKALILSLGHFGKHEAANEILSIYKSYGPAALPMTAMPT
jgi:serine/threonine protein kinase